MSIAHRGRSGSKWVQKDTVSTESEDLERAVDILPSCLKCRKAPPYHCANTEIFNILAVRPVIFVPRR